VCFSRTCSTENQGGIKKSFRTTRIRGTSFSTLIIGFASVMNFDNRNKMLFGLWRRKFLEMIRE
jgi:hypothetical protein